MYPEITFKDFQSLMVQRKRTVDDLVDIFRGKIDDPREFFERVMTCKYHHEDRSDVVIPYRSIIEFYRQELHYFKDVARRCRVCACGCGQPVFDRQKYASAACKKRLQRNKVTDIELSACR